VKKILPAPLLSLVLAAVWLLLNNSLSIGNIVLATIFAITVPWFTEPFRTDKAVLRAPGTIIKLGLIVLWDIVVSNITVARQILGNESKLRPRFVWVPLTITDPHGIAALAGIITMTPGTLSADLTEGRDHLLIHALHVEDEQALIDSIKQRYEQPLLEIFKC
jgi:multicomponent K+:H+ antiporter subunit E